MTIRNISLRLQYDGSGFFGYQIQKDRRSVQEELQKAVRKLTGETNRIIAAGRTDSGVHANFQLVNFLTASKIRPDKFSFHLKAYLPEDILILESKEEKKDFHARFSAKSKTYRYIISREKNMHPIYRKYRENITYKLNLEKIKEGLEILRGEHDFKAFMLNDKDDIINTRRTIDESYLIESDKILEFVFKGDSFLHNQVRIMAGSLIELGREKITLEKFKSYLDKNNKYKAGPTLSPSGLYLDNIEY